MKFIGINPSTSFQQLSFVFPQMFVSMVKGLFNDKTRRVKGLGFGEICLTKTSDYLLIVLKVLTTPLLGFGL